MFEHGETSRVRLTKRLIRPGGVITVCCCLVLIFIVCAVVLPARALAQESPESSPNAAGPVLTLENAVSLATSHNRLVKDSVLEAEKYQFRVNVARSKRLPQFQVAVLGGQSLHAVNSTFPAGAFGTYPGIGPIPATEATVRTPARLTAVITGAIDVPLLQQHKIGLSIGATRVASDIALEGVRAQLALDAAREGVRTPLPHRRIALERRGASR